jgi:hypothetical protein
MCATLGAKRGFVTTPIYKEGLLFGVARKIETENCDEEQGRCGGNISGVSRLSRQ